MTDPIPTAKVDAADRERIAAGLLLLVDPAGALEAAIELYARATTKAAVRESLFPLIPDTRGPIGGGAIIAVECGDLAAVSLVTDGARWGVRMDDGDEVRWLATEDEARRSFAEHIAADRALDRPIGGGR